MPGKKRKFISRKEVIVIAVAIILTTVGIKASDSLFTPAEEGDSGACGADMVLVPSANGGFCMDKYEASVDVSCPYPSPASQNETRLNLDAVNCKPISAAGAKPWRAVSQDQATLACAKAGKRLPTNKEWLAAALGTPDKNSAWTKDDCQVDNNWTEQPGTTGSGVNCKSSAGTFDMIGNVWEWVEGAVQDGVYNEKELPQAGYIDSLDGESLPGITNETAPNENYNNDYFWIKQNGLRGIVRGGYWANKADAGQYSVYMVAPPGSVEAGIGFRCAR